MNFLMSFSLKTSFLKLNRNCMEAHLLCKSVPLSRIDGNMLGSLHTKDLLVNHINKNDNENGKILNIYYMLVV